MAKRGRPRKTEQPMVKATSIEGDSYAPAIDSDDGAHGVDAVRRWEEIDAAAYKIDLKQIGLGKSITGVYAGKDAPAWWVGIRSECPVYQGAPAVQLNTGEIIPL